MHRNNEEPSQHPLEVTDEMWADASHPGWDALEAALDSMPEPEIERITFGRPRVSRLRLLLGKLRKQKEFDVEVIIYHRRDISLDGWHSCRVSIEDREAALSYCKEAFQRSGLNVRTSTIYRYWAGLHNGQPFVSLGLTVIIA